MYTITLSFISVVILAVIILSSLKVIRYVPYDRCSGEKRLLVSLGSGGHTTEMLLMLQTINLEEFTKRYYYISSGDSLSHQKLLQFESARCSGEDCYQVRTVARARKVKQPWLTTPVTALISFIDAVRLIYTDLPDLMICNGPGTCVMLVLAILLLRYTSIKQCRIIFIESFARVESLSLSGKLLIHLVDRFLVMWPDLAEKYEKAEYAGLLI